MAKTTETSESVGGETESIFDEYRSRISQVLEKEKRKLVAQAEQESQDIIARAQQEAEHIIKDAKTAANEQSVRIRAEADEAFTLARNRADEESARIIVQSKQKSEQILREAGRKAEDEAREKTKKQVEKMLAVCKEETDKAVATTRQAAKKEAEELVEQAHRESEENLAGAKLEAAQIIDKTMEKATKEAKKEALRIISAAEQKASQLATSAIALGIKQGQEEIDMVLTETQDKLMKEMGQFLVELSKRLGGIIEGARSQVQERVKETGNDIQGTLAELTKVNGDLKEGKSPDSTPTATEAEVTAGSNEKTAEPGPAAEEESDTPVEIMSDDKLYEGIFNLEIAPPVEFSHLMTLRKYLARVPDLKLVSTAGFVDGNITKTVYVIEIKRPLALIKILEELPGVESISQTKKDIMLKLVS